MRKQKDETVILNSGVNQIELDYAELRKAVLVLRAVNHKLSIYIKLRLEQSVASQHLAILRRAGVVVTDREGKFIYYSIDKERLNQISRLVEELAS